MKYKNEVALVRLMKQHAAREFNKESYREYLLTRHWKSVRDAVLSRDGYCCLLCKSTFNTQIHHKTYKHIFYEENFLDDMMTLCGPCHKRLHEEQGDKVSKDVIESKSEPKAKHLKNYEPPKEFMIGAKKSPMLKKHKERKMPKFKARKKRRPRKYLTYDESLELTKQLKKSK